MTCTPNTQRLAARGSSVLMGLLAAAWISISAASEPTASARAGALGIEVGWLEPGPLNAITDVAGVRVGHVTRIEGEQVRTGVTAILPHGGNLFQDKVPAAIYDFNSFGKLAGALQVIELGNLETPILLTNTLDVGTAVAATVAWTLAQPGNETVRSVNALVGETNDGYLNDIRGQHVTAADVVEAIEMARDGAVAEGNVGAGTGTRSFGFKSGIGTASRVVSPVEGRRYTVGVLVQSNFGTELLIGGVPVSRELAARGAHPQLATLRGATSPAAPDAPLEEDGSAMIIIATDAPLSPRNLRRMARRAFTGMGRTTPFMSNGSGDFAIAFSTAYTVPAEGLHHLDPAPTLLDNAVMNPLFRAVEEATEEAIYNALFMAEGMSGRDGHHLEALPRSAVLEILRDYRRLGLRERLPPP